MKLCTPKVAFAHPLDGGRAGAVMGSVDETAAGLGPDALEYRRIFAPLVRDVRQIIPTVLAPLRSIPAHPRAMMRFALRGVPSARRLAGSFHTEEVRGLLAGAAGHAMVPLNKPLTGSYALLFTMMAHSSGWPVVQGGSSRVTDALVNELESLGGHVRTGQWVRTLDELPADKAGDARRVTAPAARSRNRPFAGALPAIPRALQVRTWCVQGRLGARWPGPVGSCSLPGSRNRPPGRHFRGNITRRVGGRCGPAPRASLLPRGPAGRHRPERAHRLGAARCGPTVTCPRGRRST